MEDSVVSSEAAIQFAKKYLEDMLSFFGLNIDVHATYSDDVIELGVPSTHLNGFLIGQKGDTMRSMQYMVSGALKNAGHNMTRVNIDIAEYKKQRADRLLETADKWVQDVKSSGQPMDLRPMNAAERRLIHKLAADEGLSTESVGEGRDRHVVLKPAAGTLHDSEAPEPFDDAEPAADFEASDATEAPADAAETNEL